MNKVGSLGEKLVARWLELRQYKLLEQNWRCRGGEIDLILQHQPSQAITFVEVKTRNDRNWDQGGLLAINQRKQQKIINTASRYLTKFPQLADLPCRFDVGLVSYYSSHQCNSADETLSNLKHLDLGQTIILGSYQMKIQHYLEAAFD